MLSAAASSDNKGPLGWCADYTPSPGGCDFKSGACLSGMSAAIGRFLGRLGVASDAERVRILANADFLECAATSLRDAVAWVEGGHNGHSREGGVAGKDNELLTTGLRRAARAKPDGSGICNGGICILGAAAMVAKHVHNATGLTQAVGANELNRILKAATILEEDADSLRAAVVT